MAGIDTIARLLALAENAGTKAEGDLAMEKAIELAARANVDLAVARMHQKDKTKREVCDDQWTSTSAPGEWRRGLQSQWGHELYYALAKVNDLKAWQDTDGRYVKTFGYPSDRAVTDALWNSLMVQMVDQANRAIKRGDHKERVFVRAGEYNGFTEPAKTDGYRLRSKVTGQVFRANYYAGFVERVVQRCWEAKRQAERDAGERDPNPTSGAEVAIRDKKQSVQDAWDQKQEAARAERLRVQIAEGWRNADGSPTQKLLDYQTKQQQAWARQDRRARYSAPRGYDGPTMPASQFGQNAGRAGAEVASLGASTTVGSGQSRGLPGA